RRDHRLAGPVAEPDDPLLYNRNLVDGNLHAQVAARHHDPIRHADDLLDPPHRLHLLDLGYDRPGDARLFHRASQWRDVLRSPDVGCGDPINLLLETESQVVEILRSDGGDVQRYAGRSDPFVA